MKNRNLREQAKELVNQILNKDPLSANKTFAKLIMEAEEQREEEVSDELGLDENNAEDSENLNEDETTSNTSNEETDKIVDDIIEINCQINAKMISNLFDQIAELKNKIENLELDPNSREYLKYEVTIQYYSDKLQDLQNKTNPGIDQSKVETSLEKISNALKQLEGEIGGNNDSNLTDIQTPEEISAENGLNEPESEESSSEDSEESSSEDSEEASSENSEESKSENSEESKSEDSEEASSESSEESEESETEKTSDETEKTSDETDENLDDLFS